MTTFSPSYIKTIKMALMGKGVRGTRTLPDEEVIALAVQHELLTPAQAVAAGAGEEQPAMNAGEQLPDPAGEPQPARRRRRERNPAPAPTQEAEVPQQAAQEPEPAPAPAMAQLQAAPAPVAAPSNVNDVASQIAAALGQLQVTTPAAPMDEARVIELVQQHAKVTYKNIHLPNRPEPREIKHVTHGCFEESLDWLAMGEQLYYYGRSGAGKSFTAKLLAEALDVDFFAMGSILSKFEVLGSLTATGYNPSAIRLWLESDGGLLCIDEIDGSDPRALVTVMAIFDEGGQITFPDGVTLERTADHLLVVTANTKGAGANAQYNGRCRLDTATLNRFVTIEHDYCPKIEDSLAPEAVVKFCRAYRDQVTQLKFDGALITPRTIKKAAKGAAMSHLTDRQRQQRVARVCQQSLDAKQHRQILKAVDELLAAV